MGPRLFLALALALAAPAAAANTVGCGDNAFSYAEVVQSGRARSHGAVETVPETLCADLIEDRRRDIDSLSIGIGEQGVSRLGAQGREPPATSWPSPRR